MKKLNITKKQFGESKYFTNKYGTLKYVSENGKFYKTSKGHVLKFINEGIIDGVKGIGRTVAKSIQDKFDKMGLPKLGDVRKALTIQDKLDQMELPKTGDKLSIWLNPKNKRQRCSRLYKAIDNGLPFAKSTKVVSVEKKDLMFTINSTLDKNAFSEFHVGDNVRWDSSRTYNVGNGTIESVSDDEMTIKIMNSEEVPSDSSDDNYEPYDMSKYGLSESNVNESYDTVTCDRCGEEVHEDDVEIVRGEVLCSSCRKVVDESLGGGKIAQLIKISGMNEEVIDEKPVDDEMEVAEMYVNYVADHEEDDSFQYDELINSPKAQDEIIHIAEIIHKRGEYENEFLDGGYIIQVKMIG